MTTLTPRTPYSQEELNKLYPKGLELRLVQVLLRHGERAPVSARFGNVSFYIFSRHVSKPSAHDPFQAGLPAYWPYCNAAQRLRSVTMTTNDVSQWDSLQWRRRLETFGNDDGPLIAAGPAGEVDGIWYVLLLGVGTRRF